MMQEPATAGKEAATSQSQGKKWVAGTCCKGVSQKLLTGARVVNSNSGMCLTLQAAGVNKI